MVKKTSNLLIRFTESSCEVVRWKTGARTRRLVERCLRLPFPAERNPRSVSDALRRAVGGQDEGGGSLSEQVIAVIPHQRVSSRYLRIPSQDTGEIGRIINLQYRKSLPYSADEFISAWRVVEKDSAGYASVNLILIQKQTVELYLSIIRECGREPDEVYLDVYGYEELLVLHEEARSQEALLIAVDDGVCEVAVVNKGRVALSRSFGIATDDPRWQEKFVSQVMDTQSLYVRQENTGAIKGVYLTGSAEYVTLCEPVLRERIPLPVNRLLPVGGLEISTASSCADFTGAFSGSLGFIRRRPGESLNLLPSELRLRRSQVRQAHRSAQLLITVGACALLLAMVLFKHTGNKRSFSASLKAQLEGMRDQVKGVEVMAGRLRALAQVNQDKNNVLDFFTAAHQVAPGGVIIEELRYNAAGGEQFVLEGICDERDDVFHYASRLGEFAVFPTRAQVKYADSADTPDGEVIRFKIVFPRK